MRTPALSFLETQFPVSGREIMDRNARSIRELPPAAMGLRRLRSNTTVFAFKYSGGVLVAGDRRTSGGWYEIVSDKTFKVDQISGFSAIACAGDCNVIDYLRQNMEGICDKFKALYGRELSPDGQVRFLEDLVKTYWYDFLYFYYPNFGFPVLAAYDAHKGRSRIFSFDETGYSFEPEFVAGTGCGWESCKNVIVDRRQKNLSLETAIDIAVRAMVHSGLSSSGVSDARLSPPTLCFIDNKGLEWVPEKMIASRVRKISKSMGVCDDRTN